MHKCGSRKHFIDDKSHSIFHYMFTTTHTEVSNELNRILKLALNLKGAIVENADFSKNQYGELELTIHTRLSKKSRNRCPFCGRKCNIFADL